MLSCLDKLGCVQYILKPDNSANMVLPSPILSAIRSRSRSYCSDSSWVMIRGIGISIFSGRSCATSLTSRLIMMGERSGSILSAPSSVSGYSFRNVGRFPRNDGRTKSTTDHISLIWFSNGVPDIAIVARR